MRRRTLIFLVILVAFNIPALSQGRESAKSNLEIFYEIIDSSARQLSTKLEGGEYTIKINTPLPLNVFEGKLKSLLAPVNQTAESNREINYTLEDVSVHYSDLSRDGLFADYTVTRTLKADGYYIYGRGVNNFSITHTDTVLFDDLSKLENTSLPFTQGERPSEPFFSSLYRPVIILGLTR